MSTAQPNNTDIIYRKTWLVLSGIWLGLNALLHLLAFPFLLYTGLCTLLMPVSLWILSSLTTNPRTYALLNIPLVLYTLAWWFTTPLLGAWFTLLWLPFALMGGMLRSVVKKLTIHPGKRISLQRHRFRSELWTVVDGVADVLCGHQNFQPRPGEQVFIPRGSLHRLSNTTDSPVTVIELQFGHILSEEDIERFDDDFGRQSAEG